MKTERTIEEHVKIAKGMVFTSRPRGGTEREHDEYEAEQDEALESIDALARQAADAERLRAVEQAAREYVGAEPVAIYRKRENNPLVGALADPKWVRLVAALASSPADTLRPMTYDETLAYIEHGRRPPDTSIPSDPVWSNAVEELRRRGILTAAPPADTEPWKCGWCGHENQHRGVICEKCSRYGQPPADTEQHD